MAIIQLQDIVKCYGKTTAVDHVNLTINNGEFLVLLGPSGCGKTTTLRSIAGLEQIDEGKILIDDEQVTLKRPSERDIAFCFQHYALYPHLNSYNNIAFPLQTQSVDREEIDRRVKEVGEILDLQGIFKQKPRKLSSGDQQRVALARAVVRQPKVFLMDEPLSNLDAKLRVDMRAKLRLLQLRNKVTTVYVTHDQTEAMALSDRIAVMNAGKLLQVDTPFEIYTHPANLFVANFVGSPSMNFINCGFEKRSSSLVIPVNGSVIKYRLPLDLTQDISNLNDQAELVLGVRPENVIIHLEPIDNAIECKLLITEQLGSANIHHVKNNNLDIISRTSPLDEYSQGQTLWVAFETEGIRLFDRKTTLAL